jgi:hypothetical protein
MYSSEVARDNVEDIER